MSQDGSYLFDPSAFWTDEDVEFMTYQQVLNQFGRPDEVSSNTWLYHLETADRDQTITFKFTDGYLTNIYP